MNPEKKDFLNLIQKPRRLNIEQTAWELGFESHDIPILMNAHLIKPLGCPAPNAPKYFAASEIERLGNDVEWLDKASKAIVRYWKGQNSKKIIPFRSDIPKNA